MKIYKFASILKEVVKMIVMSVDVGQLLYCNPPLDFVIGLGSPADFVIDLDRSQEDSH